MPLPPSLGAFSDTVEVIYDCALNPQRWRDTLRLVGQLTDTPSIAIGIMDYDQPAICSDTAMRSKGIQPIANRLGPALR